MKRTSLKDIAQKLGVSIALVSYVLNNQKQNRISREITEKIRATATLLNYRPNQIARSLKTQKTNIIGLIVPDISNSFSSGLARMIEDEADRQGYTVIFGSSDESAEKFRKLIGSLQNRQVDGLIIAPPVGTENHIEQLQKQDIPFVLIDRYFPSSHTNVVALDNYTSTYEAVSHLYSNGYRNIGLLNYSVPLIHFQERSRGFMEAVSDHNCNGTKNEVDIQNEQLEVEKAVDDLLARGVDSIIIGANKLAISALKYLSRLAVKIPANLALVGFDETESFDFFYSPLTYIRQPLREMGGAAIQMLLENIKGGAAPQKITLPPTLIVRASSAPTSSAQVRS